MQKQEERDFDDEEGTVHVITTQLPALRAFRLMAKLGKLLGPALSSLKGIKLKGDVAQLMPALMQLFEQLDPDDVDALTAQVLEGTAVQVAGRTRMLSQAATINEVFGGRLIMLFKVMAFAIEVNFRDFFRGLTQPSAQPGAADAVPAAPARS